MILHHKFSSYFYADSCREEVTRKLQDAQDGSFLVRNSNRAPGEFTLTVKKQGQNKLLRIICKNNLYGFSEPTKFRSVPILVNYFRYHKLAQHSAQLDIKLEHPISRFAKVRYTGFHVHVCIGLVLPCNGKFTNQ